MPDRQDNHGLHTEWLAKSTIDEIIEAYPRLGWNGASTHQVAVLEFSSERRATSTYGS